MTSLGHDMRQEIPAHVLRQEKKVDARFAIAETYRLLTKAGLKVIEFEKELSNCNGANEALKICSEWQLIAKAFL